MSTKPILVVTDYAETHPDYVEEMVNGLRDIPSRSAIRLLLLARGVNAWWESLAEMSPREEAKLIVLPPLTSTVGDRQKLYAEAVAGLAHHLAGLALDPTVNEGGSADWARLATRLADAPPDLSDDRLRNALTLHMAALTDLLTAGAGEDPSREGSFDEQELVQHEFGYLRRTAVRHGLFERNVLSSRTDQYARDREAWRLLERSLAGLILLAPADAKRALAIGELATPDRAADVTAWLAALYPPSEGYRGVGSMQPNRLAELLLGRILAADVDLLGEIAEQIESYDDAITLLFVVLRTAAHSRFAHVRGQARNLILQRPVPFAEAALILTVNLAHVASAQGSESAIAALQAILQRAVSVPDSINPAALTNAIQLASERLASLRNAADSVSPSKGLPGHTAEGSTATDQPDGLYQGLAKGRPLFVRALLDVALDVIGVSFDDTPRRQEIAQKPPTSLSPPNSQEILNALYIENYQQLVRLANLLVHDVHAAEDIVQTSFEWIMRRELNQLPDKDTILGYLRQVVVNRARSALRHHTIEELLSPPASFRDIPSAEDEARQSVERLAVVNALRALPEHQREVIVLHYYADLPMPEIAKVMRTSKAAARSHMVRARRALRELLEVSLISMLIC